MERLLENYLGGQLSPSDFGLSYRIGDSFSGLTEFSVRGDGAYELRSTATRGRQERTYASTVSPDRVRQVAGDLRKARIWETRHVRSKPGEDDPLASMAVESGASKAGVELWVSEIKDVQPFREAQQSLLGLIREISNGEVLETGR